VEAEAPNVVLETLKPAEEGRAVVARLYECERSAVRTRVSLHPGIRRAALANMLEEPLEELPIVDGAVELSFRAFGIRTLLLSF
jgi:alpha-mannosidase